MHTSGFYDRGPEWVKAWYSLSLDWSETDPEYVVYPKNAVGRLLRMAEKNRDVYDLALFVAGTRLAVAVQLHDDLRQFISRVLTGQISPPNRPAGRPKSATWNRNFIIIDAMSYLELSLQIPMTKNANPKIRASVEPTSISASDILAEAITHTDLPNQTRKQIDKIWARPENRKSYQEAMNLHLDSLLDEMNDIVRE